MNNKIIDFLNSKIGPFIKNVFFKKIIAIFILCNPIALAPQLYTAIIAPSVEGISILMWTIFAIIQSALFLESIRLKSISMFWSMFLSTIISISVITVIIIRS